MSGATQDGPSGGGDSVRATPATRAVVFAYHDIGERCLRVLLDAGAEVPLVFTHEDDPTEGRWYASVADLARARGCAVVTPDDPNTAEWIGRVRALAPELVFSFYYRRLLAAPLLACARRGAFNMHGSLLPRYRGRAPLNWAILRGERETGVTLHQMVERADAGAIVDREPVPIGPDDLAIDVHRRMTDAAGRVMARSLPALAAGAARLEPQNISQGEYVGRRTPDDGRLDLGWPARRVHDLVRAVAPPFPGAFLDQPDGTRLYVLRTRVLDEREVGPPALLREPDRLVARCGDGFLVQLLETETR